jgi:hypothetical protein
VYAILSPESPPNTGDIAGSPARISFSASQSTNANLTARELDKQIISEASTPSDERGVVGLGISSSGTLNFADTCEHAVRLLRAGLTRSLRRLDLQH